MGLARYVARYLPGLLPRYLPGGGNVWTPALWFLANEQGIWLDPSDFTRYMGEKGPELFSAFTTTTGWTVGSGTWSITGAGGGNVLDVQSIVPVGKWAEVTFTVVTNGTVTAYPNSNTPVTGLTSGTYKFVRLRSSGETGYVQLFASTGSNTTISALSVRELTAINTATMFQDSAGTTPVTAVEQPVGLALDKRLGLVRGAEVVSNGTFATNVAGWEAVNGATVVHSAGAMRITSPGATANAGARQITSLVLVPGQKFEMSFRLVAIASGAQLFQETLNGNATSAGGMAYQTTPGTYKFFGTMGTGGDGFLHLQFLVRRASGNANAGDWVEIDDVSVKVLPGNHATQATTAQKPVLSARKNLLTKTEDFTNAVWAPNDLSVVANAIAASDGTMTADKLVPGNTSAQHAVDYNSFGVQPSAGLIRFSAEFKAGELTKAVLRTFDDVNLKQAMFNLTTGLVETGSGTVPAGEAEIVSLGNGWYRCSLLGYTKGTALKVNARLVPGTHTATDPGQSWAGNSADGGYICKAQLESGSTPTTYQRVNTATDYDTVGFPHYLKFDGVDDNLVTGNIDFTATDKMTVMTGFMAAASGTGVLVEMGDGVAFGSGRMAVISDTSSLVTYINGTSVQSATQARTVGAGYVHSGKLALNASPSIEARLNGVSTTTATTAGGTLFASQPVRIGRRNGTSLPFNGNLNQLVVRGAATDAAGITAGETYTAGKTGITL